MLGTVPTLMLMDIYTDFIVLCGETTDLAALESNDKLIWIAGIKMHYNVSKYVLCLKGTHVLINALTALEMYLS